MAATSTKPVQRHSQTVLGASCAWPSCSTPISVEPHWTCVPRPSSPAAAAVEKRWGRARSPDSAGTCTEHHQHIGTRRSRRWHWLSDEDCTGAVIENPLLPLRNPSDKAHRHCNRTSTGGRAMKQERTNLLPPCSLSHGSQADFQDCIPSLLASKQPSSPCTLGRRRGLSPEGGTQAFFAIRRDGGGGLKSQRRQDSRHEVAPPIPPPYPLPPVPPPPVPPHRTPPPSPPVPPPTPCINPVTVPRLTLLDRWLASLDTGASPRIPPYITRFLWWPQTAFWVRRLVCEPPNLPLPRLASLDAGTSPCNPP